MSQQQLSTAHLLQAKMDDEKGQELTPVEPKKNGCTWSGPLTIICVFFVLISFLGAYSAACGFYGLTQTQEVSNKRPRTKAERKIVEIEETTIAAKQKFFPMLMYLEIVKLGLAGAFMFATVLLISRIPTARTFVIGVCGAALFYHLCALIIMIMMMSETGTVFNSILDDVFQASNFNSAQDAEKAREYVTNRFFGYFTIAVSIAFLIRLAFYGAIMAYLWSDDVQKIFGVDPLAKLAKDTAEEEFEMSLQN